MKETICPRCEARVPVRLLQREVCPDCRSAEAWDRYARAGARLVIDRRAIVEAEARRRGDAPAAAWPLWFPVLLACSCGLGSLPFVVGLLRPSPLVPLAALQADVVQAAHWAALLGGAAVGIGVAALVRLRRGRLFRSWPPLALSAVAMLTGSVGGVVGGVHWYAMTGGIEWEHLSMPALGRGTLATPFVQSIMEATAVIVAPGEEGNVRGLTLGAGAVIRSECDRAWIVTCSHVAMPYAAVGSWRDTRKAHPVLVYFADGRVVEGRVQWTTQPPLDVALVVAEIEHPPPAVLVAPDAGRAERGAAVSFVPNPLRSGWRVHNGRVSKRVMHLSPAGEYSLLYTDLPVQPGDSGSGLYDSAGRLIGLNTWMTYGEDERPQGISLPSNAMGRITERFASGEWDGEGGR
ncbi:MAG: serine protease [Planctomycetota bacterium]